MVTAATKTAPPVLIPVTAVPTGIAATATATTALAASQADVVRNSGALAEKQAILASRTQQSTAALLGAGSATGRLDAALLGLRTAAGSSAVIGLSALALAGIAAGKGIRASIDAAAALETELNVFRATTQATADQMERVAETAQKLGADITLPGVASHDAAVAMTELAKAGLSVEDALAGARGVLQLATAAQIDNATATELAAGALNAFGLEGEEAVHVADLLANAANEAQGSISDMGLALRQSATVANQLGLSLDDTVVFLTLLARAGLRGSDAGTSLRTALTRLISPTQKAQAILDRLNITLRDASGNLRADVFSQLGAALEGVGKQERARVLVQIFGQDAQRAAAVLSTQTVPALREVQDALGQAGTAADLASARTQGFAGSVEAMKNALTTTGAVVGTFLTGPLGDLADALGRTATLAGRAAEGIREIREEAKKEAGTSFIDRLTQSLPATVNEFTALVEVMSRLETIRPGEAPTAALERLNAEARTTEQILGSDLKTAVEEVFAVFSSKAPTVTLAEIVIRLDDMADKLAEGDKEAQKTATRIRELRREIIAASDFPPAIFQIQAKFDEEQARREASTGGEAIIDTLRNILGPDSSRALGFDFMLGIGQGAADAAPQAGAQAGAAFTSSFATQLAVAQATGAGPQAELGILRAQLAKQQAFLDRLREEVASGERENTKQTDALIRQAAENANATKAKIQSILGAQTRSAADAAAQVAEARNEADQEVLKAIAGEERKLVNAQIRAEATAGLKDDVVTADALVKFYNAAIKQAQRIKDAALRAQVVADLTRDAIQAEIEAKRARQELREQRRQERLDRIREREEMLQLDLQIAQATGDVGAQRRALEAEIRFYKDRVRHAKRGSIERKRWLLALRQAQTELAELKGEAQATNNAFAELAFEFMQSQQGFAANLISNLIPEGVLPGLTGTPPSPQADVAQASAFAAARESTTTQGQTSLMIEILRQMLGELRSIRSGKSHPEAAQQAASGGTALQTM